jgi:hypothetical protein
MFIHLDWRWVKGKIINICAEVGQMECQTNGCWQENVFPRFLLFFSHGLGSLVKDIWVLIRKIELAE